MLHQNNPKCNGRSSFLRTDLSLAISRFSIIFSLKPLLSLVKIEKFTDLDKSSMCVRYKLEIINFTIDYFLTSTFTNTTFQFPEYVSNLKKLNVHIFNKNLHVRLLIQRIYFHFMFYILQIMFEILS